MKDTAITGIIDKTLSILEKEVGLTSSTLVVVASRSLKPISDFFKRKNEEHFKDELLSELECLYKECLRAGRISRNVFNLRIRGLMILREVYCTGTFSWKGPVAKEQPVLPEGFEHIVSGLSNSDYSERGNLNTLSIVRRFLLSLTNVGITDISQVRAEHIQAFLTNLSPSRSKSMDDVIGSLRKLDRYLTNSGSSGLPHAGLLMSPRSREKRIYPYMPQDDISLIIQSIDRSTAIGKRDYAILMLVVGSGLRVGDVANIKLSDIDWRKNEFCIIQGKTQKPLHLPLHRGVSLALADYILNSRPKSESPHVFLRSLAPYQRFKDGVSVASVLRRRMNMAGIEIGREHD
jgi:integrase